MRLHPSFFFVPSIAVAQVRVKLNYNKHWELTTPDSAFYIRTANYDTVAAWFDGPFVDTYANGKLQMTGSYSGKKKQGEFVFYYDNGNIESVGHFEGGARTGLWKYFYRNGTPRAEAEFAPVLGDEPTLLFLNDSIGKQVLKNGKGKWRETIEVYRDKPLTIAGNFVDNQMDGKWTVFLSNGKKWLEEFYDHGQFVRGHTIKKGSKIPHYKPNITVLMVPYKLIVTEEFVVAKGVDFNKLPELRLIDRAMTSYTVQRAIKRPRPDVVVNGEVFTVVEQPTTPIEGYDEFYRKIAELMTSLYSGLPCGPGKVFIQFVVDTDGTLGQFEVAKSDNENCNDEAITVLTTYSKSNKWAPGIQRGRPVKQKLVLPLTF